MAQNNKIRIVVTSRGPIKSIPGTNGPIYESIEVTVLIALSIWTEGHKVRVETTPGNFRDMDATMAAKLQEVNTITDESINQHIEASKAEAARYDQLQTVEQLAAAIVKMSGAASTDLEYPDITSLSNAIKAIIASGVLKNFDEVQALVDASKLVVDGTSPKALPSNNCDLAFENGIYYLDANTVNGPTIINDDKRGFIIVMRNYGDENPLLYCVQIFFGTDGRSYKRSIYKDNNIIIKKEWEAMNRSVVEQIQLYTYYSKDSLVIDNVSGVTNLYRTTEDFISDENDINIDIVAGRLQLVGVSIDNFNTLKSKVDLISVPTTGGSVVTIWKTGIFYPKDTIVVDPNTLKIYTVLANHTSSIIADDITAGYLGLNSASGGGGGSVIYEELDVVNMNYYEWNHNLGIIPKVICVDAVSGREVELGYVHTPDKKTTYIGTGDLTPFTGKIILR